MIPLHAIRAENVIQFELTKNPAIRYYPNRIAVAGEFFIPIKDSYFVRAILWMVNGLYPLSSCHLVSSGHSFDCNIPLFTRRWMGHSMIHLTKSRLVLLFILLWSDPSLTMPSHKIRARHCIEQTSRPHVSASLTCTKTTRSSIISSSDRSSCSPFSSASPTTMWISGSPAEKKIN